MVRRLVALLWPIGLLLPVVTGTPAAAASPGRAQTLIFDAIFTNAKSAGPGPSHVGHRQIVSGILRAADGRRAGTFSFTCTWTRVTRLGASEHCRAFALTSDGRLDAAGSSESGDVTQTWQLIGGTGRYRGASGSVSVRDLGDREALLNVAVSTRGGGTLHVGKVSRPAANRPFIARADDLCRRAGDALASLPPFPFPTFNPLAPDPSKLPDVGAFFTGPGDPRPILRALDTKLHELGQPPRERGAWRLVTRARDQELAVIDEQDRAALAGNVPAFVRSVRHSAANFRQIAISATAFGSTRCVL
jgi:hypothetical protein